MKSLINFCIKPLFQFAFSPCKQSQYEMKSIWSEAKVCCIVANSGIGDAVMATPLVQQVKQLRPKMRLIVIASTATQYIFKDNAFIDELLIYRHNDSKTFMGLLFQIFRKNIDVFLVAQPANIIKCALIAVFSRAKLRLKHEKDYGSEQYRNFDFVYHRLLPDNMQRHRVELNLDLLRNLGEMVESNSVYPYFTVCQSKESKIQNLLRQYNITEDQRVIAMHPGSGRKNKQWAPNNFAKLARQLIDWRCRIVLVGGKEETALCENIKNDISSLKAINFAGALSLEETAALIKESEILISNDSGIMHLATAVNIPVIALFGHTEPSHIGPYSNHHMTKVIKKSNNVSDIEVKDVIHVIEEMMEFV